MEAAGGGGGMAARLRVRVAWDECDPEGLVHAANYFRWMDQAIHALMLEARFGHRAILDRFGAYVPAVDATASFAAPATFDDLLSIETEIAHWGTKSFRLRYKGYRDTVLVFEGTEVRVWASIVDGQARSAVIPDEFRRALSVAADAGCESVAGLAMP
jgi:YbgC/YbaW family acyl-CoA thioester hydrolase